jgi:hypothetical protein
MPCGLVILQRDSSLIHNLQEGVNCGSTETRGLFTFSDRS